MARVQHYVVLCLALFALSGFAVADDNNLFATFYDSVVDMVIPSYNPGSTTPSQVVLFEMPGVGINRAEWDSNAWAANNFAARQPEAVVASFVDRLPLFNGPTFIDSGSRISTFWDTFLHQYIIPTAQDPNQVAKADAAKAALANDTLLTTYTQRLNTYDSALAQYDNQRTDCLSKSSATVCSKRMVSWTDRLRRSWFSLEVARRDISSAEALVLALQVLDLKNLFADALEQLGSSQRIDVGGEGFGSTYYVTYLTPSNFWRWWPQNVGVADYQVQSTDPLQFNYTRPGATVTFGPKQGTFAFNNATGVATYVPNGLYTGVDRVGFTYTTATGSAVEYKVINVIGSEVLLADTAFTSVSVSSSSSASSASRSSAYSNTFATDTTTTTTASWSWWSFSGSTSTDTTTSSATSSFAQSSSFSTGSSSSMSFELARVNINRPWLDTSLLQYKPVAIRGIVKGGWSDGTLKTIKNTEQRFKVLPVAFLVARNIKISNTAWSNRASTLSETSSSSVSTTGRSTQVSIGPFFIGYSRGSPTSSSRDYRENSSFKEDAASSNRAGTLSIQGPQVIGWVCTALPLFPNASEEEVNAFEDAQLKKFYKQLAANRGVPASTLTG
jgi:hypothetical protein